MSTATPAAGWGRIAAGVGIGAGLAGLATTVSRSLPEDSTPLPADALVMATSFSDYGLGAYLISAASAWAAFVARPGPLPAITGLAALALGSVHASWLAPRLRRRSRSESAGGFTLLSQNVELGQADPAEVVRAAQDADVVVLVEITAPLVDALRAHGWAERFPYATTESPPALPADGAAGTAVFSRFPFRSAAPLDGLHHQTWLVEIDLPDVGSVQVLAVHPVRPYRGTSAWRAEQDRLRGLISVTARVVVAGDFNAVDSHRPIRLLRRLGYRSSTELAGAGWQPTFPADARIPPLIEIDHVLLGRELDATRSEAVRVAGTDHLGVLARIVRS